MTTTYETFEGMGQGAFLFGKPRTHVMVVMAEYGYEAAEQWLAGYDAANLAQPVWCPACGEPIDHCQGHGEIGDPYGYARLQAHDDGDHSECYWDGSSGCDGKREEEE